MARREDIKLKGNFRNVFVCVHALCWCVSSMSAMTSKYRISGSSYTLDVCCNNRCASMKDNTRSGFFQATGILMQWFDSWNTKRFNIQPDVRNIKESYIIFKKNRFSIYIYIFFRCFRKNTKKHFVQRKWKIVHEIQIM